MKNNNIFLRIWNNPNFRSYSGLILVIFIVSIFLNFRSDNFLTLQNILNVLRQISVYGILACGMAFFMITVFVIVGVILSKTSFGRSVYAVGGTWRRH